MYNKQILVDSVNGKRKVDDPEVKDELRLLKEAARMHWERLYAHKDQSNSEIKVTPESIEEDFLYNVRLTARTEKTLRKLSYIAIGMIIIIAILVLANLK
jgi:hypothetical protein